MKKLKALSICSGIEAASVAAKGLPIEVVAFAEIDKFPSAVLKHRFPGVPNLGDFTKITNEKIQEITGGTGVDVLIGGTPCQSFSIAGLREGLDSENGNLALEYLRLADRLRPRWIVWENVPGVLSSNGGRDFGTFLGALGQLGYGWAYRILDAQFFGVPQRRRRVFVVGHIGVDWRRAGAVLFERQSLQGNPPPSRKEGKGTAGGVEEGAGGGGKFAAGFKGKQSATARGIGWQNETAPTLETDGVPEVITYGIDEECNARKEQFGPLLRGGEGGTRQPVVAFTQNTRDEVRDLNNVAGCLGANEGMKQGTYVIINPSQITYNIMPQNSGKDYKAKESETCQNLTTNGNHSGNQGGTYVVSSEVAGTLNATYGKQQGASGQDSCHGHSHLIPTTSTVRRLTPTEAARLQGFPDNWTQIPWRGKPAEKCPDGPQYKCYGNSMAVPVIRWIWERILMVEDLKC